MLIEFRVANYRSFHQEQVFSMVASADKQLPDNLITDESLGKYRLLRSAVMYGANASGKSNLVKALRFTKRFVRNSAERKIGDDILAEPFLFDNNIMKEPSRFSITFISKGVRYQFTFAVSPHRVEFEELIAYPKGLPQIWYTRHYNRQTNQTVYKFGASFKGERKQIVRLTRDDVLYLSNGAKNNNTQLIQVYNWFHKQLDTVDLSNKLEQRSMETTSAAFISHDNNTSRLITSLLNLADNRITSVTSERIAPEGVPVENIYETHLHHKINNGNKYSSVAIKLSDESLGTQRLFGLSLKIFSVITEGVTIIIDELDASLHPLLVRALVSLFHHPAFSKSRGQLIFNTHDTTLLDSSLFRRDQIWFVDKNLESASEIYPLTDFSARKDESFMRGYLQGRYGAVPYLGELPALLQAILEAGLENGGGKNGKA